jgi:hypothetical protein
VIAKNYPGALLRKYWTRILRAQWAVSCDALRAWRGRAARARLRGQIAGFLGWTRMMAKRRPIQAARRVTDEYIEGLLEGSEQRS